jgi:hypothetical protein
MDILMLGENDQNYAFTGCGIRGGQSKNNIFQRQRTITLKMTE